MSPQVLVQELEQHQVREPPLQPRLSAGGCPDLPSARLVLVESFLFPFNFFVFFSFSRFSCFLKGWIGKAMSIIEVTKNW